MRVKIAIGLLSLSLILLIIYGADVMVATTSSSKATDGGFSDRRGFLPFNESIRGGVFGAGAVILSIAGFIIARKQYSNTVTALLIANGIIIIIGMVALIGQGALNSEKGSSALRTIGITLAMGAILVGLGAWKIISDRKTLARRREISK
jgi:hypothetical protein